MLTATTAHQHALRAGVGLIARLLLVFGVLTGLFAMHGLSTGHGSPGGHAATPVEAMATTMTTTMTMTDDHPVAPATGHPADDAPRSDLAELCLAVLTGVAVLVLLLLRPLRALPATAFHDRPAPRPRRVRSGWPPLRPPDLSVLCVLRT